MKRYILLSLILLLSASCNKLLDKKPLTNYEADVIRNTENGMEMLLTGAYGLVSGRYYYGSVFYLVEAAKGPDFFVRNVSGGSSLYYENRYTLSSTTNGQSRMLWRDIYQVIRNATILIESIDDVPGDINNLRRIKGEAYALRGMAYFDLMRLFAYPPIFSLPGHSKYGEQFKWGVPILDDVQVGTDIYDYQIRRETAKDTYDYIVEQFEHALPLLEGKASTRGRVDHATAMALFMRVLLYMEQWEDVVDYGEDWINRYGHNYSILPYGSYVNNYSKPFNSESIWELIYTTDNNLGSNAINHWVRKPTIDIPGDPNDGKLKVDIGYAKLGLTFGHPNRGLDFLTLYPKDVRQYWICPLHIQEKPEYMTIRKYIGSPTHSVYNVPLVRLPEIYFMLAEGYFNMNDNVTASDYVSRVSRERRDAVIVVSTIDDILDEKRREYYLEGQTYFDHFRTARNLANRHIIESIASGSVNFGTTSSYSYRSVYPIPLREMNHNPAIRDQQNPGYAAWVLAVEDDD